MAITHENFTDNALKQVRALSLRIDDIAQCLETYQGKVLDHKDGFKWLISSTFDGISLLIVYHVPINSIMITSVHRPEKNHLDYYNRQCGTTYK